MTSSPLVLAAVLLVAPACAGRTIDGAPSDAGASLDAADAAHPRDASAARDAVAVAPVDAAGTCQLYPVNGGTCNSLPLFDATVIEPTCASGTEPTPTGGTIANGIYLLQSSAYYGGCPGTTTSRITWSICDSQWESAVETNGIDVKSNALALVEASSESVSLTIVCPMPGAATYGYDATPTTLALHVPVDSYVRVDTFAMQ